MRYLDTVLEDKIHKMDWLWRDALLRHNSGRERTQHQHLLDFWWGSVNTRCHLARREAGEWGEVTTLAVCLPVSWGLIQLRETKKYVNHLSGLPPNTTALGFKPQHDIQTIAGGDINLWRYCGRWCRFPMNFPCYRESKPTDPIYP